jgi:sugar/nucleoside kinase (ribokinase family)
MSKRNGIIGAGNWILDKVNVIDRWPGVGNLCNILDIIPAPGGGPANVLFDIAAMKTDIPLYAAGLLGNDADGDYLANTIKEHGVDDRYMKRVAGHTSITEVMSGEGKRTFFHCRGVNAQLGFEELKDIDVPAKMFYLAYLLLLDKMDSPDPEYGTVAVKVLTHMRNKGYKTVVDFVSEAPEKFRKIVLPALPVIDILIVNEVETTSCSNIELRKEDGTLNYVNLPAAVDFLFAAGVHETVVIHFPEGAAGRTKDGKFIYTPSCDKTKEEFVGSNGAGDAFCAGVMYGLHEDYSLEDAMRLGSACSNFNLRSATASGGAVSLEKMQAFLQNCKYSPMPEVEFK